MRLDFGAIRKKHWALAALSEVSRKEGIYPPEAFIEAAAMDSRFAGENLQAIEEGTRITQV
jgi:hypothetical protein